MKKTIIVLLTLSGAVLGLDIEDSITVTNDSTLTQYTVVNETTSLDFKYGVNAAQTLTTIGDKVVVSSVNGYNLSTDNSTLTFDVQGVLDVKGIAKVPSNTYSKVYVTTTITDAELSTLNTEGTVSRWVVTAGYFENINAISKFQPLTLKGLDDYSQGEVIFDLNGAYYSLSSVTMSNHKATIGSDATALTLADDTVYTTLRISSANAAPVTGVGFIVKNSSVPEPTTATLSLLALAALATRRRRH